MGKGQSPPVERRIQKAPELLVTRHIQEKPPARSPPRCPALPIALTLVEPAPAMSCCVTDLRKFRKETATLLGQKYNSVRTFANLTRPACAPKEPMFSTYLRGKCKSPHTCGGLLEHIQYFDAPDYFRRTNFLTEEELPDCRR